MTKNLSPKLARRLADLYPNSDHLDLLGLRAVDDKLVWEYARDNDFVLVTKDADFADLSVMHGFPPKVVWLRTPDLATALTSGIMTLF